MKKSKFESKKQMLDQYKDGLKKELKTKSENLIKIIEEDCIEITGHPLPLIFFKKLQGDLYRYMAKHSVGKDLAEKTKIKDQCHKTYKEAVAMLEIERDRRINAGLKDQIDPIRLSLNLNYAVFLYEVENSKKKALRILKQQIQDALDDFESWDPSKIEQIKQQVELIQENINLWKVDVNTDSEEEN